MMVMMMKIYLVFDKFQICKEKKIVEKKKNMNIYFTQFERDLNRRDFMVANTHH